VWERFDTMLLPSHTCIYLENAVGI
jgi:hypothetical protein